MCKSKNRSDGIEPTSTARSSKTSSSSKFSGSTKRLQSTSSVSNYNGVYGYNDSSSSSSPLPSTLISSSVSTRTSLSGLVSSFPHNPLIFGFSEISSATNGFLAGKLSSSSSAAAHAWRCSLRGQDVVVFQRKFGRSVNPSNLYKRLSLISRAHHNSLAEFVGASTSGDYIYLVYNYIHGLNLAGCLRSPKSPNYTVLSTWISRMQVATDLAHGLDYIHNFASTDSQSIHNRITSSSVIVTEPSFNAKLCHFGAAALTGEVDRDDTSNDSEDEAQISEKGLRPGRSERRSSRFEGARGYMSPEFKSSGMGTTESDVYAFGVVILELISGVEPLRFEIDEIEGSYRRISVIDGAKEAMKGEGERVRRWVDWRLRDSFPEGVAKEMTRVALECVDEEPARRPGMGRVAGKISKLYIESKRWADMIGMGGDVTVSLAPR